MLRTVYAVVQAGGTNTNPKYELKYNFHRYCFSESIRIFIDTNRFLLYYQLA